LASALINAGCYEDAIPVLQAILRQRSGDRASMRALAEVSTGLHDWRGALSWWERAIAAGNDTLAVIGCVLHWSRLGDFERARQLYRSHDLGAPSESLAGSAVRRWRGEAIRGKTLRLIGGDRYFGDPLQYARFAREAKEAGATVILQGPRRLLSLLRTIAGVDLAVAPHDPTPALDYEAVAFWLLWELTVPVAELIGREPYLQSPTELRARWRTRIAPAAGINVGIVWRGSRRGENRTVGVESAVP
jgi:hypothetical protein